MLRKVINIISVVVILTSITYILNRNGTNINLDNSSMYYLTEKGIGIVNKKYSENTVNCDLTAVSNCINYVKNKGFIVEQETYMRDYFDIILSKEDEVYRIYYTKDGDFTSIARPYKNSASLLTYIDGKRE